MPRLLLRTLTVLMLAVLSPAAQAQTVGTCAMGTATTDLSLAGVRARLFNNGGLFWKGAGNVYNVPKAIDGQPITPNPIFAAGLWVGGYVGTELRSVAATYNNWELWPGPLASGGNLVNPNCAAYDRIYRVTRADVAAYQQTGTPTNDLRDWPVALGAPVVDGDGVAGNYNLAGGDRPEILGTETAWWVMNDVGAAKRSTSSKPMGLEVQVTAFAMVSADPAVHRATLYRYRFINRSAKPLTDVYSGMWVDSDIGNATDDYVGSDSARGLAYTYNADNYDEGSDGYGIAPPALGLRVLGGPLVAAPGQTWTDPDGTTYPDQRRLPLGGSLYFDGNSANHGPPRIDKGPVDYYNYLNGIWQNGSAMRACGNGDDTARPECPVTRFFHGGDPVTREGWSERNLYPLSPGAPIANAPNDRSFVSSVGPFAIPAGGAQTLTFAYVYARGTSNLNSVTALRAASDRVQQAWDTGAFLRGSDGSAPVPVAAAPVHLAPADGATAQPTPVRLVWEGLSGDVDYDLQISHDAAFAPGSTLTARLNGPSHAFAPDSTGRPYHWRVRGVSASPNGPDAAGPWSQTWTFTSTPREVRGPLYSEEFLTTANAAGPLSPPEPASFAFNGSGFLVPEGLADRPNGARQQSTGSLGTGRGWGIFTPGNYTTYAQWLARVTRDGATRPFFEARGYEWRFTGSSVAARRFDTSGPKTMTVPFELWSLGADLASPSDDVRMIPLLCESACGAGKDDGVFDIVGDSPISGSADDPVSDAVFWHFPVDRTPGQAGYLAYASGSGDGVDERQIGDEAWARMALVGWNFGVTSTAYPMLIPEQGTVFLLRYGADGGTAPALAAPAQGERVLTALVPFVWTGAPIRNVRFPSVAAPVEFELARDAAFADLVRRDTVRADSYAEAFVVGVPSPGTYHWRVRFLRVTPLDPELAWSETWSFTAATSVAAGATSAPVAVALDAPRPNPTRAGARLRVGMPSDGEVVVEVFDVLGRRVTVAHEGPMAAGWTDMSLGTESLPSGVYVVRLVSGRLMRTQTLVVTR